MTEQEKLAYLAGFVDGEGCIRVWRNVGNVKRGCSPCHRLVLTVNQKAEHSEPLLMLKAQFGGWLGRSWTRQGCKPMATWSAHGNHAAAAIRAMLPYLLVKKAPAMAGLAFIEWKEAMRLQRKSGQKLSADEIETANGFTKIFSALNGNKPLSEALQ